VWGGGGRGGAFLVCGRCWFGVVFLVGVGGRGGVVGGGGVSIGLGVGFLGVEVQVGGLWGAFFGLGGVGDLGGGLGGGGGRSVWRSSARGAWWCGGGGSG